LIIVHSIPDSTPVSAFLGLKCHLDSVLALVVKIGIVESFKFGRNLEPLLTFKTKNFLDLVLLVDSHGCGNSEGSVITEFSLQFTTVFDHNCEPVVVNPAFVASRVEGLELKFELIVLWSVVHVQIFTLHHHFIG
jgi:hypothetical protein